MSLIVLGTLALDTVKTLKGKRADMLGGSAAHFAMAGRFFTKVNLISVIGEDFPRTHINFLKRKGIDLASLKCQPGRTFRWEGEYKGDMSSALTLNTELGVLSNFRPKITEEQKRAGYIFLANVDPDIQENLLGSMRSPKLVALDSMNYWIRHRRNSLVRLLPRADVFIANDMEARELSGEPSLINAAGCLHKMGPKIILIKKGEHGVLCFSSRFMFSLPAYPVRKLIDPTGAGDSFAGGFMGYLTRTRRINEKAIKKAAAYGTILASYNVEGFGLERTASLTLAEINRRLDSYRCDLII